MHNIGAVWQHHDGPWAAQYNTWLLIKLTPKVEVFSFLFFFLVFFFFLCQPLFAWHYQ